MLLRSFSGLLSMLLIFLQGYTQNLGYKEFWIGNRLPDKAFQWYTITRHSSTNSFIITSKDSSFRFCQLPIDTLWIYTDSTRKIEAVTVQTKSLEFEDFRAHNFQWNLLIQCLSNEYAEPHSGQIRFKPTLVALWFLPQRIWLDVTSDKILPGYKNEKRIFTIHWEKEMRQKKQPEKKRVTSDDVTTSKS